jgi:hypothetical protein
VIVEGFRTLWEKIQLGKSGWIRVEKWIKLV